MINKEIIRKISTTIIASILIVCFTSAILPQNILGATSNSQWYSYFGQNEGWAEGALGELTFQSENSWQAKMEIIGWGGIWGAKVSKSVEIDPGKCILKFDILSKNKDKWIFVSFMDNKNECIYGEWLHLVAGSVTNYDKEIELSRKAVTIVFGIGGEFGDRVDEADLYKMLYNRPRDGDSAHATTIICSHFSFSSENDLIDISTGKIVMADVSYKANGKPIIPSITVYDGHKNRLVKGKDYSVEYINNIKPGNGMIVVMGIGKYKGVLGTVFTINDPKLKIKLKAKKTLRVGKKTKIKVIYTPKKVTGKKIKWTVNNKKYAKINSKGILLAKKDGKGKIVTVTAKLLDGSKKKAKIKITII